MIRVRDLGFHAGGAEILRGVDLEIPEGGITALIGPNGAGKSTLLHCLAGLLRPSAGRVALGDMDPQGAAPEARARRVALLQQSPAVVSRLSVTEMVGFGRWPHHRGRVTARDRAVVAEALAAFALEELSERRIDTLSGGQRQRAFVAMTWAQETPWMLLDEPLNALDPRHARDLMARMHGLSRQSGRSIVIVLHDINAAAGWADRVVAMKDGRVMAEGPTGSVLTAERLAALYDTPFEILSHQGRPVVVAR
jgi:iron complex transport system ATP-binding protein